MTPESGADYFVARGYIVVRQDCRGRGASEGSFSKYTGEATDGYDTITWLTEQPWCNGTIVTHGVSYSAHTQAAAASVGAGPIAAMIMDSGGFSNAWESGGRLGGAFELKQVVWAHRRASQAAGSQGQAGGPDEPSLRSWFEQMPWTPGRSPLSSAPDYEAFVFEQWAHEDLDEFWRQPGLFGIGYYQNFPPVPVLTISSWYDPYVFTAVDNFQATRKANPRSTLVLGPWTHGARSVSHAGDVDFGPEAPLDGNLSTDYLAFKATWLEDALRGDTAHRQAAAVRYFLMGGGTGRKVGGRMQHGGQWRTAHDWPPPESKPVSFYLHPGGTLATDAPGTSACLSFEFNPRDPMPSRGGAITSGEPLMSGGAFDQVDSPPASRHDVLTFQTDPLSEAVTIAGEVALEVRFSSSAVDTDLTAKLIDVHPPNDDFPSGFAMNVTDHVLRARYRDDPSEPTLMEPGQIYSVRLRLPDTANRFEAGHRIRLDISSSNFPRCDVNPNTGRPVFGDTTFEVAKNTVHLGTSRLIMSAIPEA